MSAKSRAETSSIPVPGRVAAIVAAIAAICLAAAALFAPAAGAESVGQVGKAFGGPGAGTGQFFNPGLLGVDPEDGSIYGGDIAGASYRIQKFTGSGEFKASALIPRFDDAPEEKKIVGVHGIAVDHEKGLFYLIDGCRVTAGASACKATGSLFSARRILVYKTAPEGEKLVPAGAPLSLPEGAEELYTPQSIAVDPSNHEIVLLAEDSAKHTVIQRISSSGTLGARFVDTANTLKPAAGREATSIAVGPTGTTYTLTGAPNSAGAKFTRAWELPQSLASLKEVPGFAATAEAENWVTGLQAAKSATTIGAPQVTISPDGSTLYWKENLTSSGETEAGSVLVRGYSLTNKASSVFYGGGEKGTCQITTSSAGIGATGAKLVVFDFGPTVEKGKEPAYGVHILTFGPGGSGCPAPKFTTNTSKTAEVTVTKGDVVSFDAKESELFGKVLTGLEWNFGDGEVKKLTQTCTGETCTPPDKTITHRFLKAGKSTVKLKLTTAEEGLIPQPAEVVVNVVAAKPTASFTASTLTPEAGATVEFNASESFDPTGGACTQESGCPGSKEMANYHWNFGDGSEADTASPAISHEFLNAETTPVSRLVSLVVTSKDSVQSAPSEQTVEVQGALLPTSCSGGDIHGAGTAVQGIAQRSIWKVAFESSICPSGPGISYSDNSGEALRAWNINGKRGSINTADHFIGTDEAPSEAGLGNVAKVSGGAALLTIPVAQTSISIIANPPAGCTVQGITNNQLERVFRGVIKSWSELETAEGTCGSPIVRVVRSDASTVTAQFKNYLARMYASVLPCSTESWLESRAIADETTGTPNTRWPLSCKGQQLSVVVPSGFSNGAPVNKVNEIEGSIGYAPTPEAQEFGAAVSLAVQNNGKLPASEATFALPTAGGEANCVGTQYEVPVGARQKSGEPGVNIDWSGVFAAHPAVGGETYPLCMLTYDLAFRGYKAVGISFAKETTVREYLNGYVVSPAGQEALESSPYAPLPSASDSSNNVLGAAKFAANKIKY